LDHRFVSMISPVFVAARMLDPVMKEERIACSREITRLGKSSKLRKQRQSGSAGSTDHCVELYVDDRRLDSVLVLGKDPAKLSRILTEVHGRRLPLIFLKTIYLGP
jgi:hypothetical protein